MPSGDVQGPQRQDMTALSHPDVFRGPPRAARAPEHRRHLVHKDARPGNPGGTRAICNDCPADTKPGVRYGCPRNAYPGGRGVRRGDGCDWDGLSGCYGLCPCEAHAAVESPPAPVAVAEA
eukprot:scaffold25105_cov86-Isochrysis_galbana.AAC.2